MVSKVASGNFTTQLSVEYASYLNSWMQLSCLLLFLPLTFLPLTPTSGTLSERKSQDLEIFLVLLHLQFLSISLVRCLKVGDLLRSLQFEDAESGQCYLFERNVKKMNQMGTRTICGGCSRSLDAKAKKPFNLLLYLLAL